MTDDSQNSNSADHPESTPPEISQGAPRARRSGSERRVRRRVIGYRADDREFEDVRELASSVGLTVSSFARSKIHGGAPVRAVPLPVLERRLLRTLLGQLGKIGANINMMGRASNARQVLRADEVRAVFDAIFEMKKELLEALRREPKP